MILLSRQRYKRRTSLKLFKYVLPLIFFIVIIFNLVGFGAVQRTSKATLYSQEIVVQSGDSLWHIASRWRPSNTDIRIFIQEIKEINELPSALIYPGQKIFIPINE